jgi:transposase
MEFRELSDFEWEVVEPLLPPMSRVGRLGLMIGWS